MKRIFLSVSLTFVLVLIAGGSVLAAPPPTGEAGAFFVFGEFAPPVCEPVPENFLILGAGYSITDGLALGLEVQLIDGEPYWGGFITGSFGPVAVVGEVQSYGSGISGNLTGLYVLDLDPFKLGLGGGAYIYESGADFYAEVNASFAVGDGLGIYGCVEYYPDWSETRYKVGLTWTF